MPYLLPVALASATLVGVTAEKNPYDNAGQNGAYMVPYVGGYNVFSDNDITDGDKTVVVGGEYRFAAFNYGIRPVLGALVNFKGDTYGYGGFVLETPLYKDRIWFIPGAAVGAFGHGDGRDLGGALEFRTSAELAYRFDNNQRIGINIFHLSNAGIYNSNPGTEAITVTYSIPVSSLSW